MTEPSRPPAPEPQYRGADLDAERGPGLGCFYLQLVLLGVFVVLTPVSAFAGWPPAVTIALMVATIALLLVAGQTIIFLLRIVAAERGRRRPLASRTRTVGDIEAGEQRAEPSDRVRAGGADGAEGTRAEDRDGSDGEAPPGVRE